MKKLIIGTIIFMGLFPLICDAQIEKEVAYKWYTLIEDNIHYESNVEHNCEYFDKTNIINKDWIYTLKKPLEKEGRKIEREEKILEIDKEHFNILKMNALDTVGINLEMYELEFLDLNNNPIEYEVLEFYIEGNPEHLKDNDLNTSAIIYPNLRFNVEFKNLKSIKNFKIRFIYKENPLIELRQVTFSTYINIDTVLNIYDCYKNEIKTNCEKGICYSEIKVNKGDIENLEPLKLKTLVYKYQDSTYKCYDLKRLYVPGYHKNLEGFIKDENNYIETNSTITEEIINSNDLSENNTITDSEYNEDINDTIEDEKEETEDEEKKENETENNILPVKNPIAMVTKKTKNNNKSKIIYTALLIIILITSIIVLIKKVAKSRLK